MAQPATERVSPETILDAIKAGRQPMTLDDIAAAIGKPRAAAHRTLKRMKSAGLVRWIVRPLGGPGYAVYNRPGASDRTD